MRVVFMGTPEFAVPSLESILAEGHTIPLVVTAPDRPKGRGLKLSPSDVKRRAEELGLEVATPVSLKADELIQRLRQAQPDVICVVAFRILPESVYTIPRLGSFNLHASLLPEYRGAAPINWAIINGERETGVTTFFLQRSVDTGAVILQRRVPIGPETTAGELHDELMVVGAGAVVDTLRLIERGEANPQRQDDSLASPAPKLFRADCRIDWDLPAPRLHNFVRGLSPYPGAFAYRSDVQLKILRTRAVERALPSGRMEQEANRLFVGAGTGAVEILELQPEGRRSMAAEDYLRGHPVQEGESLS